MDIRLTAEPGDSIYGFCDVLKYTADTLRRAVVGEFNKIEVTAAPKDSVQDLVGGYYSALGEAHFARRLERFLDFKTEEIKTHKDMDCPPVKESWYNGYLECLSDVSMELFKEEK